MPRYQFSFKQCKKVIFSFSFCKQFGFWSSSRFLNSCVEVTLTQNAFLKSNSKINYHMAMGNSKESAFSFLFSSTMISGESYLWRQGENIYFEVHDQNSGSIPQTSNIFFCFDIVDGFPLGFRFYQCNLNLSMCFQLFTSSFPLQSELLSNFQKKKF